MKVEPSKVPGRNDKPFAPRPIAEIGNDDPDQIYIEVGKSLSTWERAVEDNFSHLYATLIKPMYASYAARRSYGTVVSAKARKNLIEGAAEVFFRNFPGEELAKKVKASLTDYELAGARRNEIAHGMLISNRTSKGIFYFLEPAMWGKAKRSMYLEVKYRFSSVDIAELGTAFQALGSRTFRLSEEVIDHFQEGPEKARKKW